MMQNQPRKEPVLLVEPGNAFRVVILTKPINLIIEQDPKSSMVRTWICKHGERAPSGQRIFREDLPPVTEEPEKPLYDELVLKEPLKFGVDGETFKKMAKKYGKK